jgi:hypothetical protein
MDFIRRSVTEAPTVRLFGQEIWMPRWRAYIGMTQLWR